MSTTTCPEYADELKLTYWDKKKGSLPSGSDVGDKLKSLQKKHDAVDWKLFDAGWPKAAKTAADLEQAFALRDRLYRGSVFALKKDALGVASAAKALEKEKGAAKPVLDAAKAIGKAANAYADAVDDGIGELKSLYDKALAALPKPADTKGGDKGSDGDGEDDEPGSALLDPKRLVAQLKQCQRTPDRTVNFAFVDAVVKDQPAVLAMHPKMSSTSLFNKLKKETGSKTGAYGSAWVDGTSLMLQLDKPLSGLVKKMRAAVKAAGFRIAKVVVWQEDGTVFEQDDEPADEADAPAAGAAGTPGAPAGPAAKSIPPAPPGGPAAKTPAAKAATAAPAAPGAEAAAFMARLKALLAKAAEVGDASLAQQAKMLGSEAGVFSRKGDWTQVDKLMTQAEALFATAKGAPAGQAAQAGAPATDPAGKTPPRSEEELDAAWLARFETTEKVYLEVMARQPADAGKLRAVMDFANGKAEAKQYAAASQALDRLDGMLAKVPAAPTRTDDTAKAGNGAAKAGDASGEKGYKGLVAYRTSLLEFRNAVATVNGQIASLKAAIPSQMPEESALADELSSELSSLTKSLLDAVDEAMNTAENVESPITDAMLDRLMAYADEVQTSELVEHVDSNPFGVTMTVQKTLMAALANIQAKWPVKY
jgi:Tfp pilus assembly major pilin PilA